MYIILLCSVCTCVKTYMYVNVCTVYFGSTQNPLVFIVCVKQASRQDDMYVCDNQIENMF